MMSHAPAIVFNWSACILRAMSVPVIARSISRSFSLPTVMSPARPRAARWLKAA
jgi:hypothetical protein